MRPRSPGGYPDWLGLGCCQGSRKPLVCVRVCVCACVRGVRSVRVDEVRVDVQCVWMCQDPEQDVAAAPAGHQVRIAACLLLLVLPLFVRVLFPVFVAA